MIKQILRIMIYFVTCASVILAFPVVICDSSAIAGKPSMVVDKSERKLSLLSGGKVIKSYHVDLGDSGEGDKKVRGDHKTPEGNFYITQKSVLNPNDKYLGSRWMRLSYPNAEDAQRGINGGIISKGEYNSILSAIQKNTTPLQKTALGGGIGIHGGSVPSFGKDWTWGCVGLTNHDAEDLYSRVEVGTKVLVQK